GDRTVEADGEEALGDVVENAAQIAVAREDVLFARKDDVGHARKRAREPSDLVVRPEIEIGGDTATLLEVLGRFAEAAAANDDERAGERDEHDAEAERERERGHELATFRGLDRSVLLLERERDTHDAHDLAGAVDDGLVDDDGIGEEVDAYRSGD